MRLRYVQIITAALSEIHTLHCVQLLLPDAIHVYWGLYTINDWCWRRHQNKNAA